MKTIKLPDAVQQARWLDNQRTRELDQRKTLIEIYNATMKGEIDFHPSIDVTTCEPGKARGCNEFKRASISAKGTVAPRMLRAQGFGCTNVARWGRRSSRNRYGQ
jgi:hypothetical protein